MKCNFSKLFYKFSSLFVLSFAELLYSSMSSAAGNVTPVTGVNFDFSNMPGPQDYSMGYLSKMFGGVGNILTGSSDTVLNLLFKYFNVTLLTIGGCFIGYTTVRSILDTAHDGEAMGKKTGYATLIRIALAVGMLFPSANTGYTPLQISILWIVKQGVGVADRLWGYTLQYLYQGGVLFQVNNNNGSDIKPIEGVYMTGGIYDANAQWPSADSSSLDQYVGSIGILRSLYCMKVLNDMLQDAKGALQSQMQIPAYSGNYPNNLSKAMDNFTTLNYSIDEKTGIVTIPGNLKDAPLNQLNGMCGTFLTKWPSDATDSKRQAVDAQYQAAKITGVAAMLSTMAPLPDAIMALDLHWNCDAMASSERLAQNASISAAQIYQDAISSSRRALSTYLSPTQNASPILPDQMIQQAVDTGWVTAGGYYYDLIKYKKSVLPDSTYDKIWSDNKVVPGTVNVSLVPAPRLDSSYSTNKSFQDLENLITNSSKLGITCPTKGECSDYINQDLYHFLFWTLSIQNGYNDPTCGTFPTLAVTLKDYYAQIYNQTGIGDTQFTDSKLVTFLNTYGSGGGKVMTMPAIGPGGLQNYIAGQGAANVLDPVNAAISNVLYSWKTIMMQSQAPISGTSNFVDANSPIEKLFWLGNSMIDNALACWSQILNNVMTVTQTWYLTQFGISAATGVAGAASSWIGSVGVTIVAAGLLVGQVFELVVKFYILGIIIASPLALAVLSIFFAMGATLCVYIPLIPYVLYTLGVISWLVFVIEAMAAAPVVAVGMMDPRSKNDEMLGQAEPAQNLLLAVFMRPSLIFIGLITGTILSYIGLSLLNNTFSVFIDSLWLNNTMIPASGTLTSAALLKFVAVLFVYTLILSTVISKCYECIYSISDQIMMWIGAQNRPSGIDAQHALGDIKGGISDTTGKLSEGAQGAARGGIGTAEKGISVPQPPQIPKKERQEQDMAGKGNKNTTPGGGGAGGAGGAGTPPPVAGG